MKSKIRLYVDHPLGDGQAVTLTREQAHYLFGVMRLTVGGQLALFNGKDGEWLAEVTQAGKRGGELRCVQQSTPLRMPPDVWLCFAPIKKARIQYVVEKAVEMGARRIVPMMTEYTNSERIRPDRLQAHAIEAAEQCGATYVPHVASLIRFDALLPEMEDRHLLFCDEAEVGAARGFEEAGSGTEAGPWSILIGPEGGFSPDERAKLQTLPNTRTVSLGPRILRAETAAVAALTLWQVRFGDWS